MELLPLLKRINHIGFDVEDIGKTIAVLRRLLGSRCSDITTIELEGGAGIVKTAFFDLQGCAIELAEHHLPASWGDTPLITGPGFHHVAFETASFDETLHWLAGLGIKSLPRFPMITPHGRVAFLDPEHTEGILYELVEKEAKG